MILSALKETGFAWLKTKDQGKPFQFPSDGYMREQYERLIRELQEKINEIDKFGDGGNTPKG